MAANRPEVDIVVDGTELKDPYNNQPFIQNLYKLRGLWESREGFGTIAEINGQLNALDCSSTSSSHEKTYGLEECLGAYAWTTEFGNDQIISIFIARSNVGNIYTDQSDKIYHYVVCIYDATTNNYWYETLYKHTGEQTEPLQVSAYYKGYYETRNYGTEFQGTTLAKPLNFFFKEYLGKLYFGCKQGVWVYNPSSFIDNRYKQVNYVNIRNELNDQQSNHYSETGLITPIVFTDGLFAQDQAYTYINNGDIYDFVDIDSINGRLVYAAGNTIYFSDIGIPNAIIGSNSFTFWEMSGNITAIKYINDSILVWSSSQTFLYQPSQGVLLSGGRAIRIHDEIGALSHDAVLFRENIIYWADTNGVYITGNGLELKEISNPIKRFFQYETINPLVHYFTNSGFADPNTGSPDFVYRAQANLTSIHLDYDQVNEQLFVVFPMLDIAWVYKDGWYLWNFSSIVESETDPETEITTYKTGRKVQCDKPWFASTQTKTYIVGGKRTYDMYCVSGNALGYSEVEVGKYTSFRIFEWKRGGAQDGSTYDYIEGRRFAGFYRKLRAKSFITIQPSITTYFDPVERFGGWLNRDKSSFYYEQDDMWLLPIRIKPDQVSTFDTTNGIKKYEISFYIDKTRWLPQYWNNTANNSIYFILPTERCSDYAGYAPSAPVATAGVTFDTFTGLITIKFDASIIPAGNLSQPWINIRGQNKHDLIYIPLRKVNRDSSLMVGTKNPTTNIVTAVVTTSYLSTDGAGTDQTITEGNVYDWNPGWFQYVTEKERTQGIDWVYKSSQIGMEDTAQLKARGSYSLISSTGEGQQITPWLYGVWNSVAGSDYKDYVSQNIDFVGQAAVRPDLVAIEKHHPVRTRFQTNFQTLAYRYFTDNLPFGAVYGDTTNPSTGNYYVDTQEVDTISTSDSVRGESVSYTFFGFLQDKANKLLIRNIKVALQAVAGRRRRGR